VRVLTVGNRYPASGGGGYERVWRALVAHLRASGHEVTVLTTDEPGPDLDRVHRRLPWFWHDGDWSAPGRRAARQIEGGALSALAGTVADSRPDVVLWVSPGGLPLALVGASGRPEAALVHDGWPVYGPMVDPQAARTGWRPEALAAWSANSNFVLGRCRTALGGAADRGRVDHPGIDPARFPASDPPSDWDGRLAVVGRVEPRKGILDAVEALAALPAAQLRVTGPAEARHDEQVVRRAAEFGVAERVLLTGPVPDVAAAYAAADVVLFPVTWEEPFGLVPLEAMSVGRPVVASGTGGSAEYLRDGENCLLVPPGDPAALARAVSRLATDLSLRQRLVTAGRATAAQYTEEGWCTAIRAMLAEIAA